MGTGLGRFPSILARCVILPLVGTALQFIFGDLPNEWLQYPFSVIAAINYVYLLVLLFYLKKTQPFVLTQSDTPHCTAVLLIIVFMTLIMGLSGVRFYHSWPFVLVLLHFMTITGFRTIAELSHFRQSRKSALIAHLGLFLLLVAAIFGNADKRYITVNAPLEEEVNSGLDKQLNVQRLPFLVKLHKFELDEYPSEIMVPEGCTWESTSHFDNAIPQEDGTFKDMLHVGAAPATYVKATYQGKPYEGWVSCGSFIFPPSYIALPDSNYIYMPRPQARSYSSVLSVLHDDGTRTKQTIQVNHPMRVGSWCIYQKSYHVEQGKWSDVSILECVRDGWYPLSCISLWLLMLSAVVAVLEVRILNKKISE